MNTRAERTVIDLSHPIEHGMTTYPGLPGPELSDHMSRAESRGRYPAGTEFHIGRISMVANTGTYLDTPFHRYPDGCDLATVDLSRLVDVPGVVIDATGCGRAIGPEAFAGQDLTGCAVLVRTGWDRHWRTAEYGSPEHPYLTAAAVAHLIAQRPSIVGIDSVNIDDLADLSRPAHTGLLGAQTPILEHLRGLERLPDKGFRLHAAPAPIAAMGSFPVRVYAIVR